MGAVEGRRKMLLFARPIGAINITLSESQRGAAVPSSSTFFSSPSSTLEHCEDHLGEHHNLLIAVYDTTKQEGTLAHLCRSAFQLATETRDKREACSDGAVQD